MVNVGVQGFKGLKFALKQKMAHGKNVPCGKKKTIIVNAIAERVQENRFSVCKMKGVPVKLNNESTAIHWLFCKEHSVREKVEGKPHNRTLFVSNVPPYSNEECLKRLFGVFGIVVTVYIHQKPTAGLPPEEPYTFFKKHSRIKGYKVAYIVFESSTSVNKVLALKPDVEPFILFPEDYQPLTGLQKWSQEYNDRIPDLKILRQEVDMLMDQYDNAQAGKLQQTSDAEDNEGWITVTKRGRNPGFARKESVGKKIIEKEKQKRSKKELLNFYTFQIRESKMKHLANLRQKFEEDKKKIQSIKQCRRFKPF